MKTLLMMLFTMTTLHCSAQEQLKQLISPQQISEEIQEVAKQLDQDYQGKSLTVLMVMKGAICLTADLVRNLTVPFILDYVSASSYGMNGMKGGELVIAGLDKLDITGRDVLLVDDIFETGQTLTRIIEQLAKRNPRTLKTLVLLVKDVPRKVDYRPDYVLFDINDHFVIGYGLDYKELYRGLPGIFAFPNDKPPF